MAGMPRKVPGYAFGTSKVPGMSTPQVPTSPPSTPKPIDPIPGNAGSWGTPVGGSGNTDLRAKLGLGVPRPIPGFAAGTSDVKMMDRTAPLVQTVPDDQVPADYTPPLTDSVASRSGNGFGQGAVSFEPAVPLVAPTPRGIPVGGPAVAAAAAGAPPLAAPSYTPPPPGVGMPAPTAVASAAPAQQPWGAGLTNRDLQAMQGLIQPRLSPAERAQHEFMDSAAQEREFNLANARDAYAKSDQSPKAIEQLKTAHQQALAAYLERLKPFAFPGFGTLQAEQGLGQGGMPEP